MDKKQGDDQKWFVLQVEIEPLAREAIEYGLMEGGALGTQFDDAQNDRASVTAYFSALPQREHIRAALDEALRIYQLPSLAVPELKFSELPKQDWLAEWKDSWQPVEVGKHFVVAPPWSKVSEASARIVIRIEPGMAFGTGTHETTRLCLRAIKKYFSGESFLDVGTGTGILAIAAAKLFPAARIEACDTDAQAIAIARENARLNGVEDRIEFRVGSVQVTTASANLVCANLTAEVIGELLPTLLAVTCERLILSGILTTQIDDILTRLGELDRDVVEKTQDGEWAALIV